MCQQTLGYKPERVDAGGAEWKETLTTTTTTTTTCVLFAVVETLELKKHMYKNKSELCL